MHLAENLWYMLYWFQEEWLAYYPVLCCLYLCDVPDLFRHLEGITLC